ncbi:MAG: NRDE family protein, partial [Ignavibacteriaceae bacterium]
LPETGLGIDLERMVSPIFTVTEKYGTRSSSVIFIDVNNNVEFTEKSYDNKNKEWTTTSFSFKIE